MASIKMNEWKFTVNNGVVEVDKYDYNMGMYEEVKRYNIDVLVDITEEYTIQTYKTFTIPKTVMETLSAYLKSMKRLPKNNVDPF